MDTKEKILDAAETYIRTRGFNSFSFRDIAADIGIKSASVHYHFGTKDDLGAAVTERYVKAVSNYLGDPNQTDVSKDELAERFINLYRNALLNDEKMCLCGMLGAEIDSLADVVQKPVREFFDAQETWIMSYIAQTNPDQSTKIVRSRARSTIAALQGALMMSRTMRDNAVFEDVAARIKMGLTR